VIIAIGDPIPIKNLSIIVSPIKSNHFYSNESELLTIWLPTVPDPAT